MPVEKRLEVSLRLAEADLGLEGDCCCRYPLLGIATDLNSDIIYSASSTNRKQWMEKMV